MLAATAVSRCSGHDVHGFPRHPRANAPHRSWRRRRSSRRLRRSSELLSWSCSGSCSRCPVNASHRAAPSLRWDATRTGGPWYTAQSKHRPLTAGTQKRAWPCGTPEYFGRTAVSAHKVYRLLGVPPHLAIPVAAVHGDGIAPTEEPILLLLFRPRAAHSRSPGFWAIRRICGPTVRERALSFHRVLPCGRRVATNGLASRLSSRPQAVRGAWSHFKSMAW
jgi:hypothetical protein